VATLLELARNHDDDGEDSLADGDEDDEDPLDKYEFWRAFKETVKILRSEMADSTRVDSNAGTTAGASSDQHAEIVALLDAIRLQGSTQPCKAALPLAKGECEVAGPRARFVQGRSDPSPIIRDFSLLPETKNAKLKDGAWEWGV